ncbi:hypothetical protein K435DRAFT_840204 [Dendrothele bispora CBS 962.96]|uniref:GST N-terminal domain-containing protein n=1 Tax=Dendrothele bispora (strain CBS 962.96) TaxID=1314807 RepID=A0A4S8LV91_DENBC|nr:hypothetical protein K435DRAFT_840204 [Dendrothele bispora CBS 962.96]
MTDADIIVLYDIPSKVGPWSPNTWKTRYSLNYKRLPFKTVWIEYPDIEPTLKAAGIISNTKPKPDGSPTWTVPAIWDPKTQTGLTESFFIAEYLDATYPDLPRLIPQGTRTLQKAWVQAFWGKLQADTQFVCPKTTWELNEPSDRYYREMILKWNGMSMEELYPKGEKRETEWKKLEMEFGEINKWFAEGSDGGPFVMGDQVSFADFALAGSILWFRVVFGKDSNEWRDITSWHDGRWGRLIAELEKYE